MRKKLRRKKFSSLFFTFFFLVFCLSCSLDVTQGRYSVLSNKSDEIIEDSGNTDSSEKSENETYEKIGEWTILVYMAADNELESAAISDLNEMETVDLPDDLNLLVLIDRCSGYDSSNGDWKETRLYKVSKDENLNKNLIASDVLECEELELYPDDETELDMGDEKTLSGALQFARRRYKSSNYALVIWGHGSGWRGFSEDKTNSSFMTLSRLRAGIENGMEGEKLDFLGFDTCFGATFEVAYEMKNCAKIMAGTPGIASESGWDYTALLSDFIGGGLTSESLYSACKNQFQSAYENYKYGAFSVLDLSKIGEVFFTFNEFSEKAASKINDLETRNKIFKAIESGAVSYMATSSPTDFYVDVFSLAEVLASSLCDEEISALKNTLCKNLNSAVLDSWCGFAGGNAFSVFFNVYKSSGVFCLSHESLYVNGSREIEICGFVSDCSSYVPTKNCAGSLLDKLFYTNF